MTVASLYGPAATTPVDSFENELVAVHGEPTQRYTFTVPPVVTEAVHVRVIWEPVPLACPNSAAARMLLAETSYAAGSYAEAARMFATLALLFDDTQIAPQAMSRAADSFEKAGDVKSAADWRAKLQAKYPQFQAASYL